MTRRCRSNNQAGEPCRAWAIHDDAYCFWHSPETAEEARAARKLGGRRRKRDIAIAFDIDDVTSVDGLRRLFEVTVTDVLQNNEPSARKTSLMLGLIRTGLHLHAATQVDQRLADFERAMRSRKDGAR